MGKETMICQDSSAPNFSIEVEIFYGEGSGPPIPPPENLKYNGNVWSSGILANHSSMISFLRKNHWPPQQNKLRSKNTTPTSKKFSEFLLLSVWPGGLPLPSTHTRARAHDENSLIPT